MNTIDKTKTIGQLVTEQPGRAPIFEQFGLDYCCGGKKPLEEACTQKGLDEQAVIRALLGSDANRSDEDETNWREATLSELADHIVAAHHNYLRRELPYLSGLTTKVAKAHGERHPELLRLQQVFEHFKADLEAHMGKEEGVLFPLCKRMETTGTVQEFPCGDSIRYPVRVMEQEHQNSGDELEEMRQLTGGFAPPSDACNTYRVLLDGLYQLEQDTHRHIHKENNILFPRAVALEASLAA